MQQKQLQQIPLRIFLYAFPVQLLISLNLNT